MTHRYRSPLRPLDLGWAQKAARDEGSPVEVDWDNCKFIPGLQHHPADVWAFTGPLPEFFVSQWGLEEVTPDEV